MEPRVTPRIGLLPLGHHYYWEQFPALKEMGLSMYARSAAVPRSLGPGDRPRPGGYGGQVARRPVSSSGANGWTWYSCSPLATRRA